MPFVNIQYATNLFEAVVVAEDENTGQTYYASSQTKQLLLDAGVVVCRTGPYDQLEVAHPDGGPPIPVEGVRDDELVQHVRDLRAFVDGGGDLTTHPLYGGVLNLD